MTIEAHFQHLESMMPYALGNTLANDDGEIAESLIVIGRLQSPGVVIMRDTELVLVPIVGERRVVSFTEIESVRVTGFFNGKGLVWKKWLVLNATPRLGFAVTAEIASRWGRALAERRGPSPPSKESQLSVG